MRKEISGKLAMEALFYGEKICETKWGRYCKFKYIFLSPNGGVMARTGNGYQTYYFESDKDYFFYEDTN